MGGRVALLLVLVLVTAPGCAVLASANTHHMRDPCTSSPAPAAIDLVLGTVGLAAVLATGKVDESNWWLTPGAILLTSGIIGTISAYSCRLDAEQHGVASKGDPSDYYMGPTTAEPPLADPTTTRDPTPEETGLPVPTSAPKTQLRLGPDYQPAVEPAVAPDKRIKCHVNPLTPCPEDQSCVLVDSDTGYCVPDR